VSRVRSESASQTRSFPPKRQSAAVCPSRRNAASPPLKLIPPGPTTSRSDAGGPGTSLQDDPVGAEDSIAYLFRYRYNFVMKLVNVEEAASQLGVSSRRVRKMLADGLVPGLRIGRAWAVEQRLLDRFKDRRASTGRPWSPLSAWAALAAADGHDSALAPVDRSRARHRLSERGLLGVVGRLASRAQRQHFYGHTSVLGRLENEPNLVRSGVSAAADHRADALASDFLEAYIPSSQAQGIIERYGLNADAERSNIVLRIVEDAVWPFPSDVRVAPRAVVAVDLLESEDERSRRAGLALARRSR